MIGRSRIVFVNEREMGMLTGMGPEEGSRTPRHRRKGGRLHDGARGFFDNHTQLIDKGTG